MPNEIGWINGNLRINEIIIPWNLVTVELKQEGIVFYFPSSNIVPLCATRADETMLWKWELDQELGEAVKDFILRVGYSNINLNLPFLHKPYYVVSKYNKKVLAISNQDRNEVIIYEKTKNYRPKWCLYGEPNYYFIAYNDDVNFVLDVNNDSTSDGGRIIIYRAKNSNNFNQIWRLELAESNYYYIVSQLSNKVLTISSDELVVQYEKQGYDYQKWRFEAG